MNDTCSGAVEAGPNAMADMVFCPVTFSSVPEFLVALNLAGKKQPSSSTRSDAFSRMVFPLTMTGSDEEKYQLFKDDLDGFHRRCAEKGITDDAVVSLDAMSSMGLSESDVFRMCGPVVCDSV